MDVKGSQRSNTNKFLKLSLKKNRLKLDNKEEKFKRDSDVIILDESFDRLKADLTKSVQMAPKIYSPIVINDSCELISDSELPNVAILACLPKYKEPSRAGNVSFNATECDQFLETNDNRPSIGGVWSPAQNIISATPKHEPIPSIPNDIANSSTEQCTMKDIQLSQKKLLDDLYGEVWKSIPTLFKTLQRTKNDSNFNGITKKLNFDDDDSDKENLKSDLAENRKRYLTTSEKKRVRINENTERKSKKKLYTEAIAHTPEPKTPPKPRNAKSTSKRAKAKSVTELVEIMADVGPGVKIKEVNSTPSSELNIKRLSFMASLADNVPTWRCDIEALMYKDNFKSTKEQLTRRLFVDFNRMVFDNGLDDDMSIIWDTKLRSTAGTTTNRLLRTARGPRRAAAVRLAAKVLDAPARLRDTLAHELCHAATWLLDGELRAAHGPLWRNWATKALRAIPELGDISRCHNMEIHFKYTYKCTKCGYSVQRHSKSIDVTKKCCGYCRGTFQLVVNRKNKDGVVVSTPARKGGANEFALYVKDNYGAAKGGRTHAQVMKLLGEQFSAMKNQNAAIEAS